VLFNDRDDDGSIVPGSVVVISGPANGVTSVNSANGLITYTPNLNFNGIDTFTYQVCDNDGDCDTATVTVTVHPINDPPVAVDDTATTDDTTPITITVLSNDSDPDGDPLTVISVGTPTSGTVAINLDNTITYTPTTGITGTHTFTYTIRDSSGLTDTATVTITINGAPVAVDDTASVPEDTFTVVDVLFNDTDPNGDTLTVISVSTPMSGTANINVPGYTVTYTPNPDFYGTDIFTYTISDGSLTDTATVTVTVIAINDAPIAVPDVYTTSLVSPTLSIAAPGVLGNDFDVEGDSLTASLVTPPGGAISFGFNVDGSFDYTPSATGIYTFTYIAQDAAPSNIATVTITVTP
jgi:hypothetical protein